MNPIQLDPAAEEPEVRYSPDDFTYLGQFFAVFEQYRERHGESFAVLEAVVEEDNEVSQECCPMFRIGFARDGHETYAHPEEVVATIRGEPLCCWIGADLVRIGARILRHSGSGASPPPFCLRYGFNNHTVLGRGPQLLGFDLERLVTERLSVQVLADNPSAAAQWLAEHHELLEGRWETFDKTEPEIIRALDPQEYQTHDEIHPRQVTPDPPERRALGHDRAVGATDRD